MENNFNWRYLLYVPLLPFLILMMVSAFVAWELMKFFKELHLWVVNKED